MKNDKIKEAEKKRTVLFSSLPPWTQNLNQINEK